MVIDIIIVLYLIFFSYGYLDIYYYLLPINNKPKKHNINLDFTLF